MNAAPQHADTDQFPLRRQRTREVFVCAVGGALCGAGLGAWLQGPDRVIPGAAIGLVIGAVCGTLDRLMDKAMAWAVGRMQNRLVVGIAGAALSAGLMGGLTLLMLAGVGWVGIVGTECNVLGQSVRLSSFP